MKKNFTLLLLGFTLPCSAQQPVGTAGKTISSTELTIEFAIGEIVTNSLQRDELIVTQGLLQPHSTMATNTNDIFDASFSFNYYPNPCQAHQGFNYQAVARNAQGQTLNNQSILVNYNILNNFSTGNAIYSETHTTSTNSVGLFKLTIGKESVGLGNFSSIGWSTGLKFLKVAVNNTVSGTVQLLSVPYALHSEFWSDSNDYFI